MRSTQRPVFITAGSLALVGAVVLLTSRIDTRHLDRALAPTPAQTDERISIALSGVDLVPTPPLPPSMFLDVLRDYPLVADANRDWSRLDPAFAGVLSQLIERMKIRGYEMVLLEGYRSPERQDLLAGLGPHVSQAEGGRSKHQYGLAADLAFLRDGRAVISERDPWALQGYQVLGVEARAAGLVWGGDWTMRDYGHVEQASGGSVLARR